MPNQELLNALESMTAPPQLEPTPSHLPGLEAMDSLTGRPEWSDTRYRPEDRAGDFINFNAARLRPWDQARERFSSLFPDMDAGRVRQSYQEVLGRHEQESRLNAARGQAQARLGPGQENLLRYVGRHSIPGVSAVGQFIATNEYNEAQRAYRAGNATPRQLGIIAQYEQTQETEHRAGLPGQVLGAIASVPALLGEAWLTGGFLSGAGRAAQGTRIGARLAAPTTRAGAVALGTGRLAAQTAGTPSLYLPNLAQRNLEAGQAPADFTNPETLRNAPGVFALGMIQMAILGRMSGRFGARPTVGRYAARVGIGVGEQQVADIGAGYLADALKQFKVPGMTDFANGLAGHKTRYGLWSDLASGDPRSAMNHAVVQAVTFAAFGLMHAREGAPRAVRVRQAAEVVEAQIKAIDALAAEGIPREQAGRKILHGVEPLVQALHQNPNLTRAEALEVVKQSLKDQPIQTRSSRLIADYARLLAERFQVAPGSKSGTRAPGRASPQSRSADHPRGGRGSLGRRKG